MELELATVNDIVEELRRRNLRFVFVGVEATNTREHTAVVAGAGRDLVELLRMLNIGRATFENSYRPEGNS